MKTTKQVVTEEKKGMGSVNEFNLIEAFVLWKNKSQQGNEYLKGFIPADTKCNQIKLIGYFNTNKKNPKEPDVRVYTLVDNKQDIEVASLWCNVSETKGTKYLTGLTNDNEKLVAFYGDENETRPYIKVYYKKD